MNEDTSKKVIYILIGIIIVLLLIVSFVSIRYSRQFKNLERAIDNSRSTAAELGATIRQQESLIKSIAEGQSDLRDYSERLETQLQETRDLIDRATSTLDELVKVEQSVDGYTGAVRGTIDQVTRIIDTTIQGLESEDSTE